MSLKVLLTGCNGFIGKNLTRYLTKCNYQVFGIDVKISNNDQFKIDINNYDDLERLFEIIKPEIVIHLAARIDISKDSVWQYTTNIIGVQNLIRVTDNSESVKRVIWASTQLVNKLGSNFINYDYYNANTSYGSSKVIGEILVKNGVKNKEWVIVRPSTVWGPGMSNHYLSFIRFIDKGLYFNVTNKNVYKSFSYIENTCFQIRHIIDADSSIVNKRTFYLSDYEPIELHKWTQEFNTHLNKKRILSLPLFISYLISSFFYLLKFLKIIKKVPFSFYNIKNIKTNYINNNELESITGKLPFKMEEGVVNTINWYKNEN